MAFQEDEFRIGKGKRARDEKIGGFSGWKRGYYAGRFSKIYLQACYNFEKHPEALYKVVSFAKGVDAFKAARQMIDYITTRKTKIESMDKETGEIIIKETKESLPFYTELGEELKGGDAVKKVFNNWLYHWLKKEGNSGNGQSRYATHMLFSVNRDPTKYNSPRVLAAVAQTLRDEFGDQGFEYVYALHNNTENAHVHVVINNYNAITKKKLRQDRQDFLRVRTNFANQLKGRGLSYIATLRRDRAEIQTKIDAITNASITSIEDWRKTYDTCTLSNQKSQTSAQMTKRMKRYEFDKSKVKVDFSKLDNSNYHKVSINKAGKPYEKILAKIAKKDIGSQDFYLDGTTENATVVFKHPINHIDHDIFREAFNTELDANKEKQNIALANRSVDILPKLHRTLSSLDRLKKSVQWSKTITRSKKKAVYASIKDIRIKLLNGENVAKLLDSSLLKISAETEKIVQEIKGFKPKDPSDERGESELQRKAGLQAFLANQKTMLGNIINQLEGAPIGDKQFEADKFIRLAGLKLMHKSKTHDELLTASKSLKQLMAQTTDVLIKPLKDGKKNNQTLTKY